MGLPQALVDRLICPACRVPLGAGRGHQWCCPNGHHFAECKGVPLLRTSASPESVEPRGGEGLAEVSVVLGARGMRKILKELLGTNYVPYPFLFRDHFVPGAVVLNLGAGMSRAVENTVNLDYFLFPSIDIVADAVAIPFADGTFDAVVSEFMIEHVADPFAVCAEMARVLKPGGRLYIAYPFIHPYHSFPSDYFRFTYSGVERLLPGLTPLSRGPLTGPACRWIGATADMLSFWLPTAKLRFLLRAAILLALFPFKYLDLLLNKSPQAIDHALTLYGFYEKPPRPVAAGHE